MGKDIEKVAVGFMGIRIAIAAGKLTGPIGMDFVPSIRNAP